MTPVESGFQVCLTAKPHITTPNLADQITTANPAEVADQLTTPNPAHQIGTASVNKRPAASLHPLQSCEHGLLNVR
ncbi:MAG: hypothetical protein ACR2IE_00540 [Candidatus Sumerlaeaceae bacterium]